MAEKPKRYPIWLCLLVGMLANVAVLVMPTYGWEFRPVRSWLSFVLFPYGMTWSQFAPFYGHGWLHKFDSASRLLFAFAPFPLYGLIIGVASRFGRVRLTAYVLAIIHTIAACCAGYVHYNPR